MELKHEITELMNTEIELEHSATEWQTAFDSIVDPISILDRDFKVVRANRAFADLFKIEPKELPGQPCYRLVHGTTAPITGCPFQKTIETKGPAGTEFFEPHLGLHLEEDTSPLYDNNSNLTGCVHIIRDVTEKKRREGKLIVTDRLASVGQMAGGIAHEINNPLTSVICFSDLLLSRGDLPADARENLEIIGKEARRIAGAVKELLTFSLKQKTEKEPIDISSIIGGVLQLRRYEQRVSNIGAETHFAADLPQVMCNAAQIEQLVLNITINAEQAVFEAHGGGKLTIVGERVGDMVRVTFSDDGPGITPDNMRRLFTPFFTTKEVGKGTGLGLSICHSIVTEHGGNIHAESEIGKGATFIVELPVSK